MSDSGSPWYCSMGGRPTSSGRFRSRTHMRICDGHSTAAGPQNAAGQIRDEFLALAGSSRVTVVVHQPAGERRGDAARRVVRTPPTEHAPAFTQRKPRAHHLRVAGPARRLRDALQHGEDQERTRSSTRNPSQPPPARSAPCPQNRFGEPKAIAQRAEQKLAQRVRRPRYVRVHQPQLLDARARQRVIFAAPPWRRRTTAA